MLHRLIWPAWIGTGVVVLAVAFGARGFVPLVAFGLGGFAAGAAIRQIVLATRRQGLHGLVGRANGGMIVHVGVVVIAVALAASSSYSHSAEFVLKPGESASLAGHTITYLGLERLTEAQKSIVHARVQVDGGQVYAPALSKFPGGSNTIGTPSVRTGLRGDVYLTLLDVPADGRGRGAARAPRHAARGVAVDRGQPDGRWHAARSVAGTTPSPDRPRIGADPRAPSASRHQPRPVG